MTSKSERPMGGLSEALWNIFDECRPLEREDVERLVALAQNRAELFHSPVDGADHVERCPATHDVAGWCSRDEGHSGAHESRHPRGPGLGAWSNERYGRLPDRESDR